MYNHWSMAIIFSKLYKGPFTIIDIFTSVQNVHFRRGGGQSKSLAYTYDVIKNVDKIIYQFCIFNIILTLFLFKETPKRPGRAVSKGGASTFFRDVYCKYNLLQIKYACVLIG